MRSSSRRSSVRDLSNGFSINQGGNEIVEDLNETMRSGRSLKSTKSKKSVGKKKRRKSVVAEDAVS